MTRFHLCSALALLTALAGLSGCASVGASRDSAATAPIDAKPAAARPAHDQRYAVAWQQTATEYQALSLGTFNAARARLEPLIEAAKRDQLRDFTAMPGDERADNDQGQPLAVIFDLDETLIDNSAFQARLITSDAAFDENAWTAWCEERRARAVPGALAFTRWLDARGVRSVYITNRRATVLEATADNLRALGFPLDPANKYLMTRDDAMGWGNEKTSRRQVVDAEYRVIALFGDNLGDFVGGIWADNATRAARIKPYEGWWGERWFVLANPTYGSWVDAVTKQCQAGIDPADARACADSWLYRD